MAITHLRGTDNYKLIEATYKGKNKSLGYIYGYTYILRVYENSNMVRVHETGGGICVYKSISVFLDNWDNIKLKKQNGKSKN